MLYIIHSIKRIREPHTMSRQSPFSGTPVPVQTQNSGVYEAHSDQLPVNVQRNSTGVATLPQNLITEEQISSLGNIDSNVISGVTTRLLSIQRSGDSDGMTDKLNALISEAKGLSPENFKKGFFGGLLNRFQNKKEELFARFETVNDRILVLAGELDKEKNIQASRKKDIEELIDANKKYAMSLTAALHEGEHHQAILEQQLIDFGNATTTEEAEALSVLQGRKELLDKTVADIQGFRLLAAQMLPKLDEMRKNSDSLINTFNNIIGKVVPAYSMVFSQYIISMDQKRAIDLQNTTIDAFNEAISNGSNLAKSNVEENAKARQRQLVSAETLKLDHENMLQGIESVKRINEEARVNRLAYANDIKQMEQKLIATYNK